MRRRALRIAAVADAGNQTCVMNGGNRRSGAGSTLRAAGNAQLSILECMLVYEFVIVCKRQALAETVPRHQGGRVDSVQGSSVNSCLAQEPQRDVSRLRFTRRAGECLLDGRDHEYFAL